MLGDGPSRSKRPRITDDDEWSEELFGEELIQASFALFDNSGYSFHIKAVS